jgi:hypothetical protein
MHPNPMNQIDPDGGWSCCGENWYLMDLYFDLPATYNNQTLSLGCRNAGAAGSAAVYFDDFRFHPVEAPLTTYVYDPHTWQVNYLLSTPATNTMRQGS